MRFAFLILILPNSLLFAQGPFGKLFYFTGPGGIPPPYLGYIEYPGDSFVVIDDVQLSDLAMINGKLFTAEYLDVISYDTSSYQPIDTFQNVYARNIAGWGNALGVVSIAQPFFRLYDIATHNLIFSLDSSKLPETPWDMVISNDRAFLLLGNRVVVVDLILQDTIATVATPHPFGFGGQNVYIVDAGNDLYIDVEYATGAIRFSLMRMDEFTLGVDTVFHNEGYANYTEPIVADDKIYLGSFDSHYDIADDSLHISQSMFWPMAIEHDDVSGAVFLSHNPGSGINYIMNGNFSDTLTVDGIVNNALFVPETTNEVSLDFTPQSADYGCPPALVGFTNLTDTAGFDVSFIWDFGDANYSSDYNPFHGYNKAGSYTVTLIAEYQDGTRDSLVIPNCVLIGGAVGHITADVDTGCVPLSVLLDANSTGAVSHFWVPDTGPGFIGADTATITYSNTGIYTSGVVLTDTQSPPCSYMLYLEKPIVTIEDDTAFSDFNIARDTSCINENIAFTDASYTQSGAPLNIWEWEFGDGATDDVPNPVHAYSVPGIYQVQMIALVYDGCTSFPVLKQISVFDAPEPEIVINGNVLSTDLAAGYQWFLDDAVIPGAVNQSYTFNEAGDYFVRVQDSIGCFGYSDTLQVIIDRIGSLHNGVVKLYPNPADELVFIELSYSGFIKIEIMNVLGITLFEINDWAGGVYKTKIDIRILSSGIYFSRISTMNGHFLNSFVK